jgi:putative transposase
MWSLPEGDSDYATRWMLIKSAFSRKLQTTVPEVVSSSRARKRERAIWQRRYWEHAIRDERDFIAHADYIHYNPVRHGLVQAAIDWPHSSFRAFLARGIYTADWGSDRLPDLPDWAGME